MAPSPGRIAIFLPLAVSIGVTFCTVVVHSLALIAVVHFVRRGLRLGYAGVRFWKDVTVVAGTTLLALVAHLIEIAGWAVVFVVCGEFPHFAAAFYHSAVNYSSLGYGDVIIETADGMLMFGVSAAMIFAIVQRLIQTRVQRLTQTRLHDSGG
jgi:Ion channel